MPIFNFWGCIYLLDVWFWICVPESPRLPMCCLRNFWASHREAGLWVLCKVKTMKVLVIQLCLTLCDPVDYSPPGSSVHAILWARILEWVVIPFSRGSSQPRDRTWVSCIVGRVFTVWAITCLTPKSLKQFLSLQSENSKQQSAPCLPSPPRHPLLLDPSQAFFHCICFLHHYPPNVHIILHATPPSAYTVDASAHYGPVFVIVTFRSSKKFSGSSWELLGAATLQFSAMDRSLHKFTGHLIGSDFTNDILEVKVLVTQSCPTLCNPMDVACQAPLSMELSRQKPWSGLSFPSPGDLPNSRIWPVSLMSPAMAGSFFTISIFWKAQ